MVHTVIDAGYSALLLETDGPPTQAQEHRCTRALLDNLAAMRSSGSTNTGPVNTTLPTGENITIFHSNTMGAAAKMAQASASAQQAASAQKSAALKGGDMKLEEKIVVSSPLRLRKKPGPA
jgi:hypothetical protein